MRGIRAGMSFSGSVPMFSKRASHLIAPALLALGLMLAPPAAASPAQVVDDCVKDEDLDGNYSNAELRAALDELSSEQVSYTDCKDIISASIRSGPRAGIASPGLRGGGGGGGDGSAGEGSAGVSEDGSASGRGDRARDPADEDGDGVVTPAERSRVAARAERKRQLARADTEAELGERNLEPGGVGAIEQTDTANGLPLPVLLALIALTLLLASGAVLVLRRRNPELLSALRRVRLPRRRD